MLLTFSISFCARTVLLRSLPCSLALQLDPCPINTAVWVSKQCAVCHKCVMLWGNGVTFTVGCSASANFLFQDVGLYTYTFIEIAISRSFRSNCPGGGADMLPFLHSRSWVSLSPFESPTGSKAPTLRRSRLRIFA